MNPSLFIVFLGTCAITAYQPLPAQTRPGCNGIHSCFTSIGDIPTKYGVAVSQDLLKSGKVHYGDGLYIEGTHSIRIINDCMNKRHRNSVDIMVWSHEEEHKVGIQYRRVWVIQQRRQ